LVKDKNNLLAIAVKGTNKITPAQPEEFKEAVRMAMKVVKENPNINAFKERGKL